MPTGYTAHIIDGDITNAQEFAKVCAHAFMFNMRDAAPGESLRFPERNDSYYAEELPNRLAELAAWDGLDEEGRYAKWSDYAIAMEKSCADAKAEAEKNRRALETVLAEVKRIDVPETHANFKKFMIEQITETMKFDGTFNEKYYHVQPYEEWVDARRGYILRNIEYATKHMQEAEQRHQESRKWISTLANIYGLEVEE
jgi:hypothetical protein